MFQVTTTIEDSKGKRIERKAFNHSWSLEDYKRKVREITERGSVIDIKVMFAL